MYNFLRPTLFKIILTLIIVFIAFFAPLFYSRSLKVYPDGTIESQANIGVKSLYFLSEVFLYPVRIINKPIPLDKILKRAISEEKQEKSSVLFFYFHASHIIFFIIPLTIEAYLISSVVSLGIEKTNRRFKINKKRED